MTDGELDAIAARHKFGIAAYSTHKDRIDSMEDIPTLVAEVRAMQDALNMTAEKREICGDCKVEFNPNIKRDRQFINENASKNMHALLCDRCFEKWGHYLGILESKP